MKMTFLGILAAVLVIFGAAAQGHASFMNGDLIRVVYDTSSQTEVLTDLGRVSSILTGGTQTLGSDDYATTLKDLGISSWGSTTHVAYFTLVNPNSSPTDPTSHLWASANTTSVSSTTTRNKFNGITTNWGSVEGYHGQNSATPGVVAKDIKSTSNSQSYYALFDLTTGAGTLNGWLSTAVGEAVPVNNGTVTQYLFQWTGATSPNLNTAQAGTRVGQLQTIVGSGGLYTRFSAVPLPPSALLLVPGLLGLIGLRKKIS